MTPATWSRVLQFRSGPQDHTFYTCDEHRPALEDGSAGSGCFFASARDPIHPVDPDDEIECDLCREP
jgi:hypothetical protein